MDALGYQLLHALALIVLFMGVMLCSNMIHDWLTPYSINRELTHKDNVAVAVSVGGYAMATVAIFIGALVGPSQGIVADLLSVGGYSLLGVVLINLSAFINDKCLLYKFSNVKEIIEDRNAGTGAVQFGAYVASGLIVAGSISGEGGGVLTALAFFFLGQLALILFTFLYNFTTPFDVHDEIEQDNVAAGIAFGGTLIALGIILMKGASGNFIGWGENLSQFGWYALLIFFLLPIVRVFFDKLFIINSNLNDEIKHDKNIGAGILEALVMIGFALVLLFVMA